MSYIPAKSVRARVSVANVTDPPTLAEIEAAYGTAAVAGSGFIGILDDNNASANIFIVFTNGTDWFYSAKLTKAS